MILANGKIYDSSCQADILNALEEQINRTRAELSITPDIVIDAICKLAQRAENGDYDELIASLGVVNTDEYMKTALIMLSRENLEYKLKNELGDGIVGSERVTPSINGTRLVNKVYPLGTLFHISAGNVDGLPAYSVAEGLLCGNVNILKLPQADNGLTLRMISGLIEAEPKLAPFIYVFDTPSEDVEAIKKMALMSDGIVVWGGEAAVGAVRKTAPPGVKLIEWGHKLSFAYISGYEDKKSELKSLAEHIVVTKQLLCSSCQNILLDVETYEEAESFCRDFLPYLQAATDKYKSGSIGERAELTLRQYNDRLENFIGGKIESGFRGNGCSISISDTRKLELSGMFGNVTVKIVPRHELFNVLRDSKNVLQTAGLICKPDERNTLTELLSCGGIVKVTRAGNMSSAFIGESHDGDFALRRYVRVVSIEE